MKEEEDGGAESSKEIESETSAKAEAPEAEKDKAANG